MVQRICANEEFSSIRLGDRRLDARFLKVMEKLLDTPTASINSSMGSWCEAKAAYRLFANKELTTEKILNAHRREALKRIANEKEVLVVQDTTMLVYTSHTKTQGLGVIAMGGRGKFSKGVFVHTAYILNEKGVPQGILDQLIWGRTETQEEKLLIKKESDKWIRNLRYGKEIKKINTEGKIVYVCDREADIWDLMSEIQKQKSEFVIRSKTPKSIVRYAKNSKLVGEYKLEIEVSKKNGETKYHQERKKQEIIFEIKIGKMDLSKSNYNHNEQRSKELEIYLVTAQEKTPPTDREELKWILKTNRPIKSLEEASRIIEIYKNRWKIESFHKILKSGCQVERTRLAEADRIKKYLTAMMVVAWRLHFVTMINKLEIDEDCTMVLSEGEWKALYCKIHRTKITPQKPPTLKQAIRWIAQLGGFLARKGDGDPGIVTIWRGWNKLTELSEFYEIFSSTS